MIRSMKTKREREYELILRSQQGDQAANEELLDLHRGLIVKFAASYKSGAEILGGWDALMQTACVGFFHAIKRFDPEHGTRLMTYAEFWIKNEIEEELARSRYGLSFSREVDEVRRRIMNARFTFYQREERWPTVEEVIEEIAVKYRAAVVTPEQVTLILTAQKTKSLDALILSEESEDSSLHDVTPDHAPVASDPLEVLIEREERGERFVEASPRAHALLDSLGEFQREVIMRRYGFPPYDSNSDASELDTTARFRGKSERDAELLPASVIAAQMNQPLRKITSTLAGAALTMRASGRTTTIRKEAKE